MVRPRTIFNLVLDDPKFGGLAIKVRSQSFLEWTDDELDDLDWPGEDAPRSAKNKHFRLNSENFAAHIVEWNLTDDKGNLQPVTAHALMSLDRGIVLDLFKAWTDAQMGKVDAPLGSDSPSGKPSVEQSIETETLSESLAS